VQFLTGTADRRYETRAVILLALGFGLVGLDRWLLTPLSPQIMRDLHLNYQDLGNLSAVLGLTWGVFSILMGRLSDKVGRRKILIPAIVIFSLLSGASGLATGLGALLIARMLMGMAEGAYCPTSYAACIDASPPERRGLNLGIIAGSFALFGLALGPIIATQLISIIPSWRAVFGIVALPGLVLAAVMYFVIRDPSPAARAAPVDAPNKTSWRSLLHYRNVRVAMLSIFCAMSGLFVLGALTPVYLTDAIHLSGTQMGFVMSGLGLGGFLGQIVLCGVSDMVGRRPAVSTGFLLAAIALILFALVAHEPLPLFGLLFMAAFFCCGVIAMLSGPVAGEAVPPLLASSAMGAVIGAGEIFGGGVAPAIAGLVAKSAGLSVTLVGVACVLLAGGVISLLLTETAPRIVRVSTLKQA